LPVLLIRKQPVSILHLSSYRGVGTEAGKYKAGSEGSDEHVDVAAIYAEWAATFRLSYTRVPAARYPSSPILFSVPTPY